MDWIRSDRSRAITCVGLVLLTSLVAVGVAPAFMPASYSIVTDSVSESAGQGVGNAWVARSGLMLMGLGVLGLASLAKERWGRAGTLLHGVFGVMTVAVAVFSAKAWAGSGIGYVAFEDTLHSWGAALNGMGFAFGVMAAATVRKRRDGRVSALDIVGFGASFVLPAAMFYLVPDYLGLMQRLMFIIAYAWYGVELVRLARATSTVPVALVERRAS